MCRKLRLRRCLSAVLRLILQIQLCGLFTLTQQNAAKEVILAQVAVIYCGDQRKISPIYARETIIFIQIIQRGVVKLTALFERNACIRVPQKRNTERKRGKFTTTFCAGKRSNQKKPSRNERRG